MPTQVPSIDLPPPPHSITHGTPGLELGYMLVLVPMLIGLAHERAPLQKFLLSPVAAVLAMILASFAIAITSPLLRIFGIGEDSFLQDGFGMVVTAVVGYAGGRALARYRGKSLAPEHRRGAVVTPKQPAAGDSIFGRKPEPTPARHDGTTLAGIPIPLADETKHFKLIGTTGTGKSTAIRELLAGALARGDRAVIADPDGGYLNRFYDPDRGDVILNPFDDDALKWDLFGEIHHHYDIEQLARSLIPDGGDSERIWCDYARTFLIEVIRQTRKVGVTDDRELFRLLKAAPVEELRKMLAGTAAGPFLEEGNEKMFGSIRSVASSAVRALEYTTQQQAKPFSVRRWVRQGAAKGAEKPGGGVLFLPYTAGQIAALRSVISAWLRLAIFEAMDCGEGDQRLWFIIDELDALGEIDGLKDALARIRKFGGRCVVGLQSIAQMSGTYGRGAAETIVENCANTVIFRCSASERGGTSEFASKLIGQREVLHTTVSKSRKSMEWRASTTTSQHLRIEPAVMASEIERLPDLTGFLKLASLADWQQITLTPTSEPVTVRVRRPAVVTPPPPAPGPEPADSEAVASPAASARRAKSRTTQRRTGPAKRTRQPKASSQQTPAPSIDSALEASMPPPASGPDVGNGVVQNRAGGAESNFQAP